MPLIIATFVLAVILGLFTSRRVALAGTGLAAIGTAFAFVWAVVDGQGDDPWWLLLIAAAGGGLALVVAHLLSQRRAQAAN